MSPDKSGFPPRMAAYQLLMRITGDGKLLPEALSEGVLDAMGAPDRARARRLVTETLRVMDRADRMIKPFLQGRTPLALRNALRLGTVEMWMFGEAPHGVVNAYVEVIAQDKKHKSARGMVNAVLRRISEERPGAWDRLPVPRMPDWLRVPMIDAWGKPAVAAMEAVHATKPPVDLTAKTDPKAVARATDGVLLPNGSIRLHDYGQVAKLPGYKEGDWWVQDAAASIPARALAVSPGETVLDLCAAPGGKTMQLAAAGGLVTAVDISDHRMSRVSGNLARTGLSARLVTADAMAFDEIGWDAILLDAPCSATGTLRRHPDLPRAKDGSEFAALFDLQTRLIDHAFTLLKPGGRLLYSTCSLLPDEGEAQIEEALSRHDGLVVDADAMKAVPGVDPVWLSDEGGLRLRPDFWADQGGMDGFYLALLRKPG